MTVGNSEMPKLTATSASSSLSQSSMIIDPSFDKDVPAARLPGSLSRISLTSFEVSGEADFGPKVSIAPITVILALLISFSIPSTHP